jgi:hypothetical protein
MIRTRNAGFDTSSGGELTSNALGCNILTAHKNTFNYFIESHTDRCLRIIIPSVIMKLNETSTDGNSDHAETNKLGASAHFGVGVRTIENWLKQGIVVGRMEHGEIVLDLADSEIRLMQYTDSHLGGRRSNLKTLKQLMQAIADETKVKRYMTIKELADYFSVCPKEIGEWKRAGLLVFIQVKRVVRFQVAACEQFLLENPMP